MNEINLFSATCGPGLIGGLLIGSTFAKSLSIGSNKPFIPINHLEAHVLSIFYNNKINFPHLSLLITGGHTQIYFLEKHNKIIKFRFKAFVTAGIHLLGSFGKVT